MLLLWPLMEDFLRIIFSFPTLVYTILLGVMVFLWLLTLLGMLDIDALDFDLDFDGEAEIDMNLDNPTAEGLAGFLVAWGLTGVPLTITLTLFSLTGWFISYFVVYFLFGLIPDGFLEYLAGAVVLIGSFFVSLPVTAMLIKPLKPLFDKAQTVTRKYVLGQVGVVRTSRVTDTFGEVSFDDGGAGLLLKARAATPNNLKKGDRVALIEYDKASGAYLVISEQEFTH